MDNQKSLFLEIEKHILEDDEPSLFFHELAEYPLFLNSYPFSLVSSLINIPQSPKYHPEGSVWNHTLMVIDEASKRKSRSRDARVFMWNALLHDIGKAPTTKIRKGRITSYDHDKVGAKLSRDFLKKFSDDNEFIEKVSVMVRWHMQPLYVLKGLPFAEIKKMNEQTDIEEVALFSICDRLGRGNMNEEKKQEEERNTEYFLNKCREYLS